MATNKSTFSVVVPVYKDNGSLVKLIDSMHVGLESVKSRLVNVVIVNNDPQTPLRLPTTESWLPLVVVDEAKPGSYNARNRGVSASASDWTLFVDSDCVMSIDYGAALETALEAPADVICGSVEIFRDGASYLSYAYEYLTAFPFDEMAAARTGVTANMLLRRASFDALGGFDGSLKSSGDVDICNRASSAKMDIVFRKALKILHPARPNMRSLVRKQYRVSGGRFQLLGTTAFLYESLRPPLKKSLKIIFSREKPYLKLNALIVCTILYSCRIVFSLVLAIRIAAPSRS